MNTLIPNIAILTGLTVYILKSVFELYIRKRELRSKYFYELKASKVIELCTSIVEIQMIIDRGKAGENGEIFESNMFKHRIKLDKYFWESKFYFNKNIQKIFIRFLEILMLFESKEIMQEYPNTESDFELITEFLLKKLKAEII